MNDDSFSNKLAQGLPVLFCYIGWAEFYDGTEAIIGNAWLDNNPTNAESAAFVEGEDGYFRCGIGSGNISDMPIHVVFVARDPADHLRKVIGIYAAAMVENSDDPDVWPRALTHYAVMYPSSRRSELNNNAWAGGTGVRRWASRRVGTTHEALLKKFESLREDLLADKNETARASGHDAAEDESSILEGQTRVLLQRHRSRERKLRQAKIVAVLRETNGHLACEVPGCGFDFLRRYGELGRGYAHVHHLKPLATLQPLGEVVSLRDLAIVCANCHAMIHRGGESRQMTEVL